MKNTHFKPILLSWAFQFTFIRIYYFIKHLHYTKKGKEDKMDQDLVALLTEDEYLERLIRIRGNCERKGHFKENFTHMCNEYNC